jgi:hypothetical protein
MRFYYRRGETYERGHSAKEWLHRTTMSNVQS